MILDVRHLSDSKLYEKVANVLESASPVRKVLVCINTKEDPHKMKSFIEKSGFNVTISSLKDCFVLKPL